jgi:pilus assembly protein CpaF
MVMMAGFDMPINAIREQMASAFDVIIQISRLSDGSRKVVSLTEVAGMEGPRISLQDVFAYKQQSIGPDGKVIGELAATGIRPQFADRIRAFGIELGEETFDIGRWR